MDRPVKTRYDALGDILYIDLVEPYAGQETDMLSDYVIARTNPRTGEVENLELLFFVRTLNEEGKYELPLLAHLIPSPEIAFTSEGEAAGHAWRAS